VCNKRGGAGVADADLAVSDDADALKPGVDRASGFERSGTFVRRHCRFDV